MPENPDFAEYIRQLANDILVWVGFGTIVGLLAKAIMPGKDPGGAIATLAMGVGGTMIGCGVVSYFYDGRRVTPLSAIGLSAVATLGAFVILFFYRLLSGYIIHEGEDETPRHRPRRSSRRRRRRRRHLEPAYYEE